MIGGRTSNADGGTEFDQKPAEIQENRYVFQVVPRTERKESVTGARFQNPHVGFGAFTPHAPLILMPPQIQDFQPTWNPMGVPLAPSAILPPGNVSLQD